MREITIFCPTIGVGGVEKNLYLILNYLVKKQLKINLITCNYDKKKNFNKKINIIGPNNKKFCKSHQIVKIIICLIYFFKSNLIKKKTTLFSFQSNIYLIIVAYFINHKIITRINASPDIYLKNPIKKIVFSIIYKLSSSVIVNSYDLKKKIKDFLNINSTIIYNPVFIKKKRQQKTKKKNFKNKKIINLLNVGRLTYQKNQILLLKAFKELKNLNCKLTIIGNGTEENNLKYFIKINKLKKKIKIIKNITNIKKFLKNCDAFILTSRFEGLPNVLLEAQIMKKFIISSNCPTGPREILMNGKAGYLFKNNNLLDLKIKIKKFILQRNTNQIFKKIKIGYKNLDRFDANKNLEKYYKEIIKL
tara:strand:- start:38 stop:1123 length:1086 start_codon:yes stop_codon:yes gene_type:complete